MRPDPYKQARSRAHQAKQRSRGQAPRSDAKNAASDRARVSHGPSQETPPFMVPELDDPNTPLFDVETAEQLESVLKTLMHTKNALPLQHSPRPTGDGAVPATTIAERMQSLLEAGPPPCAQELAGLPAFYAAYMQSASSRPRMASGEHAPPVGHTSLTGLLATVSVHEKRPGPARQDPVAEDHNESWLDSVI